MADDTDDLSARPDILLMLYEGLPNDIEAEFQACLNRPELKVEVFRHPGGPYAGVELYVPTAIALFIAAGFFNGVLQEAGKDGYLAFKRAAIALWRRAAGLKFVVVGTQGKVSRSHSYSLSYSITGEVVPGLRFKLLVQTEISAEDLEVGVDAFIDFINDLLNARIAEEDAKAFLTYRPVGGTVLVTFDAATRKIIPVNAYEKRDQLSKHDS